MANTNTREAQQRARAKLAERRQREDDLIEAVTRAMVTREDATEALAAAETSLAEAVSGLAELGIGRDELAAILEVPAEQLGGKTRGRPRRTTASSAPAEPAGAASPGDTDVAATPDEPVAKATRARKRATIPPDGDAS